MIETTEDAYAAFDDYLDEIYPPVLESYAPSRALFMLDPTAYRCAFNDWCDSEGIDTDDLDGDLYRH